MNLLSITKIAGIVGVPDPEVSDLFSEIVIELPKREIRLRCNPDSDELVHTGGTRKKRSGTVSIVVGSHRVEWLWAMTNHQGYFDGIRLQLVAKKQRRILEFLAIASCLEVSEAKRLPRGRVAETKR